MVKMVKSQMPSVLQPCASHLRHEKQSEICEILGVRVIS